MRYTYGCTASTRTEYLDANASGFRFSARSRVPGRLAMYRRMRSYVVPLEVRTPPGRTSCRPRVPHVELEVQPVALKVLGRTAAESSRTSRKPSDDAAGFSGAEPSSGAGRWPMDVERWRAPPLPPSRLSSRASPPSILRCQGRVTEARPARCRATGFFVIPSR